MDEQDRVGSELNMQLMSVLNSIDTSIFKKSKNPEYLNVEDSMQDIDNTMDVMHVNELKHEANKRKGDEKLHRQNKLTILKMRQKLRDQMKKQGHVITVRDAATDKKSEAAEEQGELTGNQEDASPTTTLPKRIEGDVSRMTSAESDMRIHQGRAKLMQGGGF